MYKFKTMRTPGYKPLMAWFSFFVLGWILFVLYAGGFTTSIKAGMAFLDWPLSNGSLNPEGWTQNPDQLAEHSHRLLGMVIGFLMLILFVWSWLSEERRWMRQLAGAILVTVILQGLIGGARVRFDSLVTQAESNHLAQAFAIIHACLAQILLCLLVSFAVGSSRRWIERSGGLSEPVPRNIRYWGLLACGLIFLQLITGALVRHSDAALAIPTFPLTPEGGLIPQIWSTPVTLHFIHRLGAVLVTLGLCTFIFKIGSHAPTRRSLKGSSIGLLFILAVQIFLGALVIWTQKNPYSATIHMLIGALILAKTWMLTFLTFRLSLPVCEGQSIGRAHRPINTEVPSGIHGGTQ